MSINNHRVNFVLPDFLHNAFVTAYPACLSAFLRRAIEMAVNDKRYFDFIYFRDYTKKENS